MASAGESMKDGMNRRSFTMGTIPVFQYSIQEHTTLLV
jgi:hypothetical protein